MICIFNFLKKCLFLFHIINIMKKIFKILAATSFFSYIIIYQILDYKNHIFLLIFGFIFLIISNLLNKDERHWSKDKN